MPTVRMTVANQSAGLGWGLWVVLAALPWLQPLHEHPWTAFYSEALAAAAIVPVALWAVWRGSRDGWAVDGLSAMVLVLAIVPWVQAWLGFYVFRGEAQLVALYLAGFAFTIIVARNAEASKPLALADSMFAAIAVASIVSTGLMLYQWLGQDWLSIIVHAPRVAGRVHANLGQPNNVATLLAWGLIAIWWGHARVKVGAIAAVLASSFLLLGMALTRSRTGWAEVALLAAAAVYFGRRSASRRAIATVLLLCAAFAMMAATLDHATQALQGDAPGALREQASAGKRPMIWRLALDEITGRPWFGYGWNQGVPAQMQIADRHPELQVAVQHAHNFVLDLIIWNGVPLGLAILAALGVWAFRQWRVCRSDLQRLLLLALAVLLVHALLELPHTYLYVLLPAAVMMGTLNAMAGSPPLLALPRPIVALVAAALTAALLVTVNDYRAIERDLMAARLRAANIYNPNPAPRANPIILGYLQTALEHLRTEPSRELPQAQILNLRRTLERYPSSGGLIRYAHASALQRQPEEARWALERLCLLNPKPLCDKTLSDWRDRAQTMPELAAVKLPDAR
jgi:O-antigen ligase